MPLPPSRFDDGLRTIVLCASVNEALKALAPVIRRRRRVEAQRGSAS
jgi:hypothetical protein